MRTPANLFVALLAFAASARGHAADDHSAEAAPAADSDVVVLTKDTFTDFAAKPLSLIEFYAPWCGHCQALAPHYEKAATELKDQIPIAKVDCTVEQEVCEQQKVQGFPTLKIFRNGEASEYKGQRTAESIVSTLKKQALPAVSELEGDKVAEFAASDRVVVVGYFKSTDSKEYKAFSALADKHRDNYLFGATTDKAAAKEAGVKFPHVTLFKKFDEGKTEFDGDFTAEELESFVKTNSVPNMDDVGPDNFQTYVQSGLPIAYLFVDKEEQRKELGPIFEPLAKQYKGKLNFVYLDATKYGAHGKNLNLKEGQYPAFAIQEPQANLKYPFDQSKEITKKAITKFVETYTAGKLEPSLASEEIPTENDGPVKVVVGKQYDEIVNDKSKDVFIEFYAPWCGHCKKLAPIWEDLGKKFEKIEGIVIAKMDSTANDLPVDTPFTVEGFPTLKLVKAKTNEVVNYEGDRTLESLAKFVKENAVHGDEVEVEVEEKEVEVEESAATPSATGAEDHDEL